MCKYGLNGLSIHTYCTFVTCVAFVAAYDAVCKTRSNRSKPFVQWSCSWLTLVLPDHPVTRSVSQRKWRTRPLHPNGWRERETECILYVCVQECECQRKLVCIRRPVCLHVWLWQSKHADREGSRMRSLVHVVASVGGKNNNWYTVHVCTFGVCVPF